jgi:hypothetical protein
MNYPLTRPCPSCTTVVGRHAGRGLCTACWDRHWVLGTLHLFPRATRPAADVVEDYGILRRRHPGASLAELARHMDMTPAALDRALVRHRARRRVVA